MSIFPDNILIQRYRMGRAATVIDYAERKGSLVLFRQETEMVSSSVRYVGDTDEVAETRIPKELYVCQLHDVAVVGSSNMCIGKRGELLYDLLIMCISNENYRLSDRVLKKHHGKPVHLLGRYVMHYMNAGMKLDAAISLVCNFSSNYYHFIYEAISKFYLLDKCQIPEDVPLLVDERIKDVPQLMELLRLFAGNRQIVFLKVRHMCRVKVLYYVSGVNQIIPNYVDIKQVRAEDNLFCPAAILFIRQHFLDYASAGKTFPKRFYIARKNTNNRSYNEKELTQIARDYDFEVVSPEDYTVADQFLLFANAECVIAASGAALSNIVCCKPGCRVLVLFSHVMDLTVFSSIASCLNIDMRYLIGKCVEESSLQTPYTVNADDFKKSITEWLIKE